MIWETAISTSVGIIGIPIGIIGIIVAVVFGLKSLKAKKPVWAYKTKKIIGLGTDAPPELKLTFSGRPVKEVFRTAVLMFNKGRETIRKEDVTEKVTIQLKGAKMLREPAIKALSKEYNKFEIHRVGEQGQDSVELGFLYLDHDDGVVFEILHTQSEATSCSGNIMGAKGIVYIGELHEGYPISGTKLVMFITIGIVLLSAALLSMFGILPSPPEHQTVIRGILFGGTGVLLGIWTSLSIYAMRLYFRFRKFPRWAKGVLMEETTHPAMEGIDSEAYCFKCRTRKRMKDPEPVVLKNGRLAVRGLCPDCGSKMFRIYPRTHE